MGQWATELGKIKIPKLIGRFGFCKCLEQGVSFPFLPVQFPKFGTTKKQSKQTGEIYILFTISGVKRKAENAMPTVFDGTSITSKISGRRDSAGPTVNKK